MTFQENDDLPRLRLEHEIYADLASTLTSTLDLSEVLAIVMEKVGDLLKPRNWSLMLMEPDDGGLRFEIAVGEGAEALKGLTIPVGEGIAGWVARTGEGLLIENVREDPRFCNRFDEMSRFETRSIICVPLISRGKVLGVLELINHFEQAVFTQTDMRALKTIAEYAAIAISNAALYEQAQRLSVTDDHTSLYNVRYLYDALDRELQHADDKEHEVSIIFFDLDHFKRVVDTHGHLLASKVLREVGFMVREITPARNIPVRYGGDEFVVLMPGTRKEEAVEFAEFVHRNLNSRFFLCDEGLNLQITASFGVASYPRDAKDKRGLLSFADVAMYSVKDSTRDAVASA